MPQTRASIPQSFFLLSSLLWLPFLPDFLFFWDQQLMVVLCGWLGSGGSGCNEETLERTDETITGIHSKGGQGVKGKRNRT